MYINPGCDHGMSSRCLGLHRNHFDLSRVLSTTQSKFLISVPHRAPLLVSALKGSSFVTQIKKMGPLCLQRRGIWECSDFKSGQVHAQLRSSGLYLSPWIYMQLPPLAESAIDFSSKAKVTLIPPEFPAESQRKDGLLQNQNESSGEIHSPKDLWCKSH